MKYSTKGVKKHYTGERKVRVQLYEVQYSLAWKIMHAVLKVTVRIRNDPHGHRS